MIPERKFNVFPNPTRDYLLINSAVTDARVYIFDISGKMLMNELIKNNRINISGFPKGVYTIRIVDEKGSIIRKFVKQ